MTDSISVTGLEVYARHGVLSHEADHPQPFVIDITVYLDLTEAGATDRLTATIDYGALAQSINQVVAGERWELIERVAERVAETVLADERSEAVEVTVHKPHAPVAVPFEDVAVRIHRAR